MLSYPQKEILEATDSLSSDSLSYFFIVFKQFAFGTWQGSTREKTGDKMGIMTGPGVRVTETKSTETMKIV